MPDYGKARFETTIVKADDEGMPSVKSIAVAAQALGLGVSVVMSGAEFHTVRIPHPAPVVVILLDLAYALDAASEDMPDAFKEVAEATSMFLPVTAADLHQEAGDSDQLALHECDGQIHVVFKVPTNGIFMNPEESMQFAERLRSVAAGILAREGAGDAGGATEA